MTATRGELASLTIADRVRRAGGVMVVRDGHPVAGHFGSTAAELAVCVKRVGLAIRSDLDVLDLAAAEPWLDHLLSAVFEGRTPSAGAAVRAADAWCCRVGPDRAVIVGPWSAAARWTRIARHAVVTGAAIGWTDRADGASALTLVGPRAGRLLADAGLPELPVAGVSESWWAGSAVLVLREAADRHLLVVDAEHAVDAWQELFDVGRALGLSMVGAEALERLAAAPHALAGRG
jgi:glycine cleavage system aminomethyltransferase T